jgi:hypothetical protein
LKQLHKGVSNVAGTCATTDFSRDALLGVFLRQDALQLRRFGVGTSRANDGACADCRDGEEAAAIVAHTGRSDWTILNINLFK